MNIQLYNGVKDNIGKEIEIQAAIDTITNELQKETLNIRNFVAACEALKKNLAEDPEEKNGQWSKWLKEREAELSNLKSQLPAVTWSGTFTKRSIKGLKQYSQLICIDIDKLSHKDFTKLRQQLCTDPHTFVCFTSPSGNGIKVVLKLPTVCYPQNHTEYFLSIEKYFLETYKIQIDKSGKDVSRLCFLCHDAKLFVNNNSKIYEYTTTNDDGRNEELSKLPLANNDNTSELSAQKEKPLTKAQTTELTNIINPHDVFQFTEKLIPYTSGNRNRFLYLFANNCNRKGISMNECDDYCRANMTDREPAEITQTIQNAYNNNQHEHAKFAKKNKTAVADNKAENENTLDAAPDTRHEKPGMASHGRKAGTNTPAANSEGQPGTNGPAAKAPKYTVEDELFWFTSLNEKTGKETLSLSYGKFFDWLENEGFHNLKIDTQNVELIKLKDGVVEPVIINNNRNDVKHYINKFCKQHGLIKVLEMLHRGEDKYFNRKKFANLNYKTIEFLKDTADTSYYFHSNCVVEVTATGIKTRPYRDGEKALWRSQIIDKPFHYQAFDHPLKEDGRIDATQLKSEWAQFQCLVSSNPEKDTDAKTANYRFYAHATAFGYLINGFKPSDGKAIVAVDHDKSGDRTKQNGRTGKGLFAKAVGWVKKRYNVDGQTYDPKDKTVFDAVTMDVKVITVTDCNYNFDFRNFYNPITEDFTFRKMYIGYVTIPYALSPKWYFDSNFSFKGEGDSLEGRQHVIEFDNFFSAKHRPTHHFGHTLFIDWNEEQWNHFYNYAYWCDMLYKDKGLIDYPGGNYGERKLMNEVPVEFIDWIEKTNADGKLLHPVNSRMNKKEVYAEWVAEANNWGLIKQSAKAFTKYMNAYCKARNYIYVVHKSGGIESVWISDGTIPEEKLKIMGELQFTQMTGE